MRWFKNTRAHTQDKARAIASYASGQGDVHFLTSSPDPSIPMPPMWRTLHALPPADRVATAVGAWTETVGSVMPSTIEALRTHATDVEVMRLGPWHMLLYTVRVNRKESRYFIGGNPLQPVFPKEGGVQRWWADVPITLQRFYEQTHDGFHDLKTRALGPSQLRDVRSVPDVDPASMDERLKSVFTFFVDPEGRYLLIDLRHASDGHADVWNPGTPPTARVAFWPVVDSWVSAAVSART